MNQIQINSIIYVQFMTQLVIFMSELQANLWVMLSVSDLSTSKVNIGKEVILSVICSKTPVVNSMQSRARKAMCYVLQQPAI